MHAVERARPAGDEHEDARTRFTTLFRQMAPELRSFVRRHGGADLVDDVVAETFVVVWRRWSDVPDDPSARRGWVYGVARNKTAHAVLSRYRQARLRGRLGTMPTSPAPDPHADLAATERARDLLTRLPAAERDAVVLTVVVGLSTAEAADALGCSASAVTTRLHRARRRLRHLLTGTEHDGGAHA